MSDTPELKEIPHEIPKPNLYSAVAKPQKDWFGDGSGYSGTPIELDGEKFYYKQLPKSMVRAFAKSTRKLQNQAKALEKQQGDELEQVRADAKRSGGDVYMADLSDERYDFYDEKAEAITDELNGHYLGLLEKGVVGWTLGKPLSKELLSKLPQEDKVTLCQEITMRSTAGVGRAKN